MHPAPTVTAAGRRGGFAVYGRCGIKWPLPFTAHHQVAIALRPPPGEVLFRRQTPVPHHPGVGRRAQTLPHPGERRTLNDVAVNALGPAHETAAIQHPTQGHQGTVTVLRLGVHRGIALEIGIGQVIEGDGGRQPELNRPGF